MQHPYQHLFDELAACFSHQKEISNAMSSEISSAGTLDPTEALQVYRRAVIARLTEALGEKYKKFWRYCGDEEFFEYTYAYFIQHPSQVYDLGEYGENFPEFLESEVPDEDAFLPDLARLERCHTQVFHKCSPTISSRDFIQKHQEKISDIELHVSKSADVVSSKFPIFDLWEHLKNETWDETLRDTRPQSVLVYKNSNKTFLKIVSPEFVLIFRALDKNKNLSSAMESLENSPVDATDVQTAIEVLVSLNLIS